MKNLMLSGLLLGLFFGAQAQGLVLDVQPGPAKGMDTQLRLAFPNNPSGNIKDFKAIRWTCGGAPCGSRGLLKFDLDTLGSNAIVDSAFLYLYHNPSSSDPGHSTLSGSNATWLRVVTSPWHADTVTYNTQPTWDTTNQHLIGPTVTGNENFQLDVSLNIRTMLDPNHGNHGWILMLDNETEYRSVIFASSNHLDPLIRPRLKVYYRYSGLDSEDLALFKLQIYPNPARTEVQILHPALGNQSCLLQIIDINGRLIKEQLAQTKEGRITLSLRGIEAGNYIVKVLTAEMSLNSRLIVRP